MDTFPQKLDILLSDAASRFPGFSYTLEVLGEEVENYKRFAEMLVPFIADAVHVMNESIAQKKRILVEGGQATMLDTDFGTYPFVTSSSPSAALDLRVDLLYELALVEVFSQGGDLLSFAGQEFGTNTGHPCHCGWLDIVAFKFCCLDVLSDLPEIRLGVAHKHVDGTPVQTFPADLRLLEQLKVEYEVLPGWKCDISSIRNYFDLPKAARQYVESIEELVGVPIHYIGVGPGGDALIFK
ncbi:hypothetical protein DITRI_Ditri06bG0019000 [Diplodiscus trichospermus]